MASEQLPSQPQRHRRQNNRETAQEHDPVAATRRRENLRRTAEVAVKQRRKGAEAQSFVDGH